MTPEQKIKHLIINKTFEWEEKAPPEINSENIDDCYNDLVEENSHWDGLSEIRGTGIETNIPKEHSRHYENKSVAMQAPDGSWIGWTFWYGGGKHGEPESIDWMGESYDLECKEKEKTAIIREFKKVNS